MTISRYIEVFWDVLTSLLYVGGDRVPKCAWCIEYVCIVGLVCICTSKCAQIKYMCAFMRVRA